MYRVDFGICLLDAPTLEDTFQILLVFLGMVQESLVKLPRISGKISERQLISFR